MNRRTLLSALGFSAASCFTGLSAITNSGSTKQTWVVSLESFRASHADQMPHLHSYLGGTFLPYLTQIHRGPKMFLDAIVAPHTPQALVLTAFPSFAEMIEIRGKIAAHPEIQRAHADRECGEAQILITSADSLRFHTGPTRPETAFLNSGRIMRPRGAIARRLLSTRPSVAPAFAPF